MRKIYIVREVGFDALMAAIVEQAKADAENASEKAKLVDFTYHCYKTGMLNAVSVGFIAKEAELRKDIGKPFDINISKFLSRKFACKTIFCKSRGYVLQLT